MAIVVYPIDKDPTTLLPTYSGRMLRETLAAVALGGATSSRPLGIRSGVRPGTPNDCITLSGSTWTLAKGFAGAVDAESAAEAGPYLFAAVPGTGMTGTLTAADANNPRADVLAIQVSDPAESDGTSLPGGGAWKYTAGTAAASPSLPATPARSIAVARFDVPKSGGGNPTVTWIAPVLTAAGGMVLAPTLAVLNTMTTGFVTGERAIVYGDSTATNNGLYRWNGSAWGLPSTSGTLTLGSGYSFSSGSALNQLRFRDGQVMLVLALDKSSTVANGDVVATLPAGFRPPSLMVASGFSTATNSLITFTISSAGAITIFGGAGAGTNVRLHIVFETV